MTSLEPVDPVEEFARRAEIIREHNAAKIREVLGALEPYVLGLHGGPINPAHVRAYLEALGQLGKLWRVFDPPARVEEPGVDEGQVQVELAARQEAVLGQLREIEEKRQAGG